VPVTRPPLRTALVGFGLGGQAFHAPFLDSVEGLALTSIVTADPERRALAAARYPHAALLASADELWRRADDHDLVVVTTANRAHVPLTKAALAAGLPVVVDKPLAPTAAEGAELVAAAAVAGRMLTVFQNRRWDTDLLTLRRLLADGELGDVWRFESRFERWRPEVDATKWRESAAGDDAGGLLFDLGSHLVDQALVLFGPARTVYAELAARRPGAAVDDDAFVALTHDGGVVSHHWMSATAGHLGPRLRVLGSRGAFVVDGLDGQEAALRAGARPNDAGYGVVPDTAWGCLAAGDDVRPVPAEPGAYPRFYEGVVAAVRDGAPPPVDPRDAVAVLTVLEAARRSAERGEVVRLPG
jgi:predicted dehydrogenase